MDARVIITLALSIWPQVSPAHPLREGAPRGCINTAEADASVSLEGRLITATFSDPYGKERVYILQLPEPTCIDDGGQFANAAVLFAQVQVAGINSCENWSARRLRCAATPLQRTPATITHTWL